MSEHKNQILAVATEHVCPNKIATFGAAGIDLVIGKREGPYLYDIGGRELIDCHINGGTYNLGHRNPELIQVLKEALDHVDIGNHHFASKARNVLAQKLIALTPGDMKYVVFASGGSEAIDVAIKTARHATKRRTIIGIEHGYHGRTGLSGATGDDKAARFFLSEGPDGDFINVPFNDLAAMCEALSSHEAAAVIIETIPATLGFPIPEDGYLPAVKDLCQEFGAAYIADEVQTGLGRTGKLWATETFGIIPDILVTGKGLSGGLYPIAATVISEQMGGWLLEDGFAHVSTFGGSEIGCHVASKVLDMCSDPATLDHVSVISEQFADGLSQLQVRFPGHFIEIRRSGLVMGLKFKGDMGAVLMSKLLYENGIWAMFSGFDLSILQFKPILLADKGLCDKTLERLETALKQFAELMI